MVSVYIGSIALAVAAPSFGGAADESRSAARVEHLYNLAIIGDRGDTRNNFEIIGYEDPSILRSIPRREGLFNVVVVSCASVSREGKLRRCLVNAPAGDRLSARVGRRLVRAVTVTLPDGIDTSEIEHFMIQFRFSNSIGPALHGPCVPPTCTVMPAAATRSGVS